MVFDRYGTDPLRADFHSKLRKSTPMTASPGLVVEDVSTGFVGAVIRCYKAGGMHLVELEDRYRNRRAFPLGAGFWVDGNPVTLSAPLPTTKDNALRSVTGREITNSGSRKNDHAVRPQVAKASQIWVEGKHDAQLIAYVWGEDLQGEGIVLDSLEGVDNLPGRLASFQPSPRKRVGVLVDHLVPGSKESRIAQELLSQWGDDTLLIAGHPFVDIWQAVKPVRLGLENWPEIPRHEDIKVGTLKYLGWPHESQADIAQGWVRILRRVRDWRDLSAELLAPVESLIDFVTAADCR